MQLAFIAIKQIAKPLNLSSCKLFFIIRLPLELLPVNCWSSDVMPSLDAALLYSSMVGSDLGSESGLVEELRL